MNAYLAFDSSEVWHLAGWTMLHYLWLGTLVGIVALISRLLLRRAAPNVRYTLALGWLMLLAILPLGIAAWLATNSQTTASRSPLASAATPSSPPTIAAPQIVELSTSTPAAPTTLAPADSRFATAISNESVASDRFTLAVFAIQSAVPFLPWLWLVGTPMTFALLTAGLVGTKRLRRASRAIDDGPITTLLSRLASSLRITRRVSLAVCDRIASPILVGIVRPIILLPPAALTGWSPDEIEMVLLHELAHVRRWDNLVNLIQRLIESLLFFHPAIWLISTWVRRERETCCDAFVVRRTDRPHAYAELLVALAAQLCEPSEPGRPRPRFLTMGASSAISAGPLRSRIRRILQLEDDPMLISGKSLTLMLASLFIAATLTVLYLPTIGQAEESTTEATESTGKDLDVAAQEKTQKNLKRLIMAVHNNHGNWNSLPAHAIYDTDGKPLLSWRVHLLPFLAEEKLYREFHLDEPWDSEHNRKLIARMPDVFRNPKVAKPGMTNYLAVVGKECVFNGTPAGLTFSDITDGTSKTIAIVEADADSAVVWTKPQDWKFNRHDPTAGLGSLWRDHWYGAWVDGSVRSVDNREPADKVGIYFTRAGRELTSLKESANRRPADIEGEGPGGLVDATADALRGTSSKFPSLEDQKLADLAWKRLGLEMEAIGEEDLKRVKALGYDGGLKVTAGAAGAPGSGGRIQAGDILVGLHVWPTTSMQALAEVLNRDDLPELNPLKFYIIRQETVGGTPEKPIMGDVVRTGRVSVSLGSGLADPREQPMYGPEELPASAPMGLQVYFFHSEDSPPSRRMKALVARITKQFFDTHFIEVVLADKPKLAQQMNVRAVPTCVFVRDGKEVARLVGSQTEELVYKTINAAILAWTDPAPDRSTDAAASPAAGTAAAPKSALRYDGKSFDEWRDAWQTELSTEKRIEAVKALAAFSANGYGKEAAETILEIAMRYDWHMADRSQNANKLQVAVLNAFLGGATVQSVPAADWFPMVMDRIKRGDKRAQQFIRWILLNFHVLGSEAEFATESLLELTRSDLRSDALIALAVLDRQHKDPRIVARLQEMLGSDDTKQVIDALGSLNYANEPLPFDATALLFHPDEGVRANARSAIRNLRPRDGKDMGNFLLEALEDANRADDHVAAIRAIGSLGRSATPAYALLDKLMMDRGKPINVRIAAMKALERITGDGSIENRLRADVIEQNKERNETPEFRMEFQQLEQAIQSE